MSGRMRPQSWWRQVAIVALIILPPIVGLSGGFSAYASGARSHQNVGLAVPEPCTPLLFATPGYNDCMAPYSSSKIRMVITDAQLKRQPNSSSGAVSILNKGTQVVLIERMANGFWCHVRFGDIDGYVPFEVIDWE